MGGLVGDLGMTNMDFGRHSRDLGMQIGFLGITIRDLGC